MCASSSAQPATQSSSTIAAARSHARTLAFATRAGFASGGKSGAKAFRVASMAQGKYQVQRAADGKSVTWNGQARDAHALTWATAVAGLWPQTLFGSTVIGDNFVHADVTTEAMAELGLAEAQQVLVHNGLRSRIQVLAISRCRPSSSMTCVKMP